MTTLVGLNVALTLIKQRSRRIENILEGMDQIRHAVLERNGEITIIERPQH